jgi:hypothetical protein
MGLDACVYCDCVEKNRLSTPHPYPKQLYIERNGSPEIRSVDSAKQEKHDAWIQATPCKHDEMTVDDAYLGNAGFIGLLRDALRGASSMLPACPVLLSKVLYSGTHTGDFLSPVQVSLLHEELQQLKAVDLRASGLPRPQIKPCLSLLAELERLSKSALKIRKPIAF